MCTNFALKSVGQWSAGGERITVSADDVDFIIGFVRKLQVPPRAPKRQLKGCLFFVSRWSPKRLKPLVSSKNGKPGVFSFFHKAQGKETDCHVSAALAMTVVVSGWLRNAGAAFPMTRRSGTSEQSLSPQS